MQEVLQVTKRLKTWLGNKEISVKLLQCLGLMAITRLQPFVQD